jgi:hypothetical protein
MWLLHLSHSAGKNGREAIWVLKRHLARIVMRLLSQPVSQASSVGA